MNSKIDNFTLECYRTREELLNYQEVNNQLLVNFFYFISVKINKLLNKLNSVIEDFSLDIGWIQLFELKSKDYKDWGKVYYLFPVGDRSLWDEHLTANSKQEVLNYETLLRKLFTKKVVHERIYYDTDISTNYILNKRIKDAGLVFEIHSKKSAYSPAYSYPFLNLGIPIKYETETKGTPIEKAIIHLGIWDCEEVKGFLTLRLKRQDTSSSFQDLIIKHKLIKEYPSNNNNKNFYSIDPESSLNKSIKIFSEMVILPVLNFVQNSWKRKSNRDDINNCFKGDFIKLLNDKIEDFNKIDLLKPIIVEFLEYAKYGYANSEELAMKVFYELFADRFKCFFSRVNTVQNPSKTFEDLKKSQEALFWIPEYRDHFIHSIKVFLLGNIILSNILKDPVVENFFNDKKKLNTRRLQFAWAGASCFHDFAICIQEINPLIRELISHFMIKGEDSKKELELEIPNLIIGNHLIDSRSVSVLKLMKISGSPTAIMNHLSTYDDILRNKLIDNLSFKFLKRKADHGVASAIAFMSYALLDFLYDKIGDLGLEDFLKDRITLEGFSDYSFNVSDPIDLFDLYLAISKAILKHNYIFDDDKEYAFSIEPIDFEENPLGFILALVDNLQDFGRPSNYTSPNARKKFCEVKGIKYDIGISALYIYVDYVNYDDNSHKDTKEEIEEFRKETENFWTLRLKKLSLSKYSPISHISVRWAENQKTIGIVPRDE